MERNIRLLYAGFECPDPGCKLPSYKCFECALKELKRRHINPGDDNLWVEKKGIEPQTMSIEEFNSNMRDIEATDDELIDYLLESDDVFFLDRMDVRLDIHGEEE